MQHIAMTSRLAHNSIKAEGKDKKHQDIVYNALKSLRNGMGTAGDIAMTELATEAKIDYVAVGKRLSELVADNRIYIFSETGGKSPSKRACRIYKVVTGEKQVEQQGDLFAA